MAAPDGKGEGPVRGSSDERTGPQSVVVVLGGPDAADLGWLRDAAAGPSVVIAADSGVGLARVAGVTVHHLVGDLDSASPADVEWAVDGGAEVHRHLADKDATDGELALDLAVLILGDGRGAASGGVASGMAVVGGGGGRVDHLLGDLVALTSDRTAHLSVTARFGRATVTVVRPGRDRRIVGRSGELVSLLAITEPAVGITTAGLRWPLDEGDLAPGSTRGMSNEMTGGEAQVGLRSGLLLVVQPGEQAREIPPRATAYDPSPRIAERGFDRQPDDRA